MTPISASLTIHKVRYIEASAHAYKDAPFTLNIRSDNEEDIGSSVIIYLDDDVLTRRLVAAINEICKTRREELQPAAAAELAAVE